MYLHLTACKVVGTSTYYRTSSWMTRENWRLKHNPRKPAGKENEPVSEPVIEPLAGGWGDKDWYLEEQNITK